MWGWPKSALRLMSAPLLTMIGFARLLTTSCCSTCRGFVRLRDITVVTDTE